MWSFPFFRQLDSMDCGPACLQMVSKYYGKSLSLQKLRDLSYLSRQGVSLLGISDAAESLGFQSTGARMGYDQLRDEAPMPCIAHWKQNHFVVVYKVRRDKVYVADPAFGTVVYHEAEFRSGWESTSVEGSPQGHCLLLRPSPSFFAMDDEKETRKGFSVLFSYLKVNRKLLVQISIGFLLGSFLQLLFPLLTQSMVDIGINNQDLGFVYLVLAAQLFLFISRVSVEFTRSWILLHIGSRVNISLVSDFLTKFMKLPMEFFETKLMGDYLQRISDQKRIETFLASASLSILFSLVNVLIFAVVLAVYNLGILLVFLIGSALYVSWIAAFMQRRRTLDYKLFEGAAQNQNHLVEIFSGMQEIKLNNCESQKRWEWERVQAGIFRLKMRSLRLEQYQQAGASFINELKNILITFMAAAAVIHGHLTLGMMLAVSYILGQLNSPLNQLIYFMQLMQDARISLDRITDIAEKKPEADSNREILSESPSSGQIKVNGVTFQYEGPHSPTVLNNISLEIPENKITAIVGVSGSGKTTLIRLLLGFYQPVEGEIRIGDTLLSRLHPKTWRNACGAVLQDGFVFSDTLARNIAPGAEQIDPEHVRKVSRLANLDEFVDSLPMGYHTKVGRNGQGLSQGQKQRLLIARALYKDPGYLFFDEATNALDARNEKQILENLQQYFTGKTVVVVAHRLSTVRNADQIIVLHKGTVTETGTHDELIARQGAYYHLIRDQLELGL